MHCRSQNHLKFYSAQSLDPVCHDERIFLETFASVFLRFDLIIVCIGKLIVYGQ